MCVQFLVIAKNRTKQSAHRYRHTGTHYDTLVYAASRLTFVRLIRTLDHATPIKNHKSIFNGDIC